MPIKSENQGACIRDYNSRSEREKLEMGPPQCTCFQRDTKDPLLVVACLRKPSFHGILTRRKIPRNTTLGKYTGQIIVRDGRLLEHDSDYLFIGHTGIGDPKNEKEPWYQIDALNWGNEMRYINHACKNYANTYFTYEQHIEPENQLKEGYVTRMYPVCKSCDDREIEAGEELVFDYGALYWQGENRRCHCLHPFCHNPDTLPNIIEGQKLRLDSSAGKRDWDTVFGRDGEIAHRRSKRLAAAKVRALVRVPRK